MIATPEAIPTEQARTLRAILRSLNVQQRRFCIAYAGKCNGNGTRSAIAAGYSRFSAHTMASDLLQHPKVKEAVRMLLEVNGVTVDACRGVLAAQLNARITDYEEYLDGSKSLKELELDGVDMAPVRSASTVEFTDKQGNTTVIRRVTLYSSQKAAETLAKVADGGKGSNDSHPDREVILREWHPKRGTGIPSIDKRIYGGNGDGSPAVGGNGHDHGNGPDA